MKKNRAGLGGVFGGSGFVYCLSYDISRHHGLRRRPWWAGLFFFIAEAYMNKPLSEMTLEELWELFPVVLSEHKDCWADWYEEEKLSIEALLPDRNIRISHIGSTAVPRIWAKPIIDILIELPPDASMADAKEILVSSGWICMCMAETRISLNKGYTSQGFAERVFHIHLRYAGDHDELYFRDYMAGHPALAGEYERLKLSLWKKYEHDRDAYTDAKSAFVRKYTDLAKAEYGDRY